MNSAYLKHTVIAFLNNHKNTELHIVWGDFSLIHLFEPPEWAGSSLVVCRLDCPVMMDLSSLNRNGTCVPCIGRQILNHWTTGEVPALNSYIRKADRFHIKGISFHLKKLEKEEKIKPKLSRRKKIMKCKNQWNRKQENNTENQWNQNLFFHKDK